jgi:hypothetical protein
MMTEFRGKMTPVCGCGSAAEVKRAAVAAGLRRGEQRQRLPEIRDLNLLI